MYVMNSTSHCIWLFFCLFLINNADSLTKIISGTSELLVLFNNHKTREWEIYRYKVAVQLLTKLIEIWKRWDMGHIIWLEIGDVLSSISVQFSFSSNFPNFYIESKYWTCSSSFSKRQYHNNIVYSCSSSNHWFLAAVFKHCCWRICNYMRSTEKVYQWPYWFSVHC